MRITRDLLIKLARDTVEKRFKPDLSVVAVFLVGSILREDPFLGGTTDIDLLVITKGEPPLAREIVKLSNEIHLDISFEAESLYARPRELRGDAWRGWMMWDPMLLHEKGRFFEYTQSIVRQQFDDAANLLARSRSLAAPAREAWTMMQLAQPTLPAYLSAVEQAVNAAAALSGPPLTIRRLMLDFPARARQAGRPAWNDSLLAMLGALDKDAGFLRENLPRWESAYQEASKTTLDLRIHAARQAYFKQGIETAPKGGLAGLWPMLVTWEQCHGTGVLTENQQRERQDFLSALGLDDAGMETRLQALDHFLDTLEETLDTISAQNGL